MNWSSGDLSESFKLYKQGILLYFKATKIADADMATYISLQVGQEEL